MVFVTCSHLGRYQQTNEQLKFSITAFTLRLAGWIQGGSLVLRVRSKTVEEDARDGHQPIKEKKVKTGIYDRQEVPIVISQFKISDCAEIVLKWKYKTLIIISMFLQSLNHPLKSELTLYLIHLLNHSISIFRLNTSHIKHQLCLLTQWLKEIDGLPEQCDFRALEFAR